jgi:hypothetical protein
MFDTSLSLVVCRKDHVFLLCFSSFCARCVEWVVVVDTLMKSSSKLRFHYVCFNPERYYINYIIFDIQILPVLSGLSILDLALGFPNVYLHYNYIVV